MVFERRVGRFAECPPACSLTERCVLKIPMPVFVRLIRFTDAGLDAVGTATQKVVADTMAAVEGVGAKVLYAYFTLGTFDVVSILEAKDDAQVEAVDQALHELGYYVAIERASAVPLDEFVALSKTAPVFVTAWLQGRRALDVDRSGRLPNEPPKAASPTRTRPKGVDERNRSAYRALRRCSLGSDRKVH